MARQKGVLKVRGTLDDLTFYKSQDGYLIKTKSGVTAERIATDPSFIRTRENNAEFANSANSGKLTRDALKPIIARASDGRVSARLTQLMSRIKNEDSTSARGLRNVGVALSSATAKALLKGFEFNKNALLESILSKPYTVNTTTGVITINGLIVAKEIAIPPGASHVSFSGCYATINYVTGVADVKLSGVLNLATNSPSTNVTLTPSAVPTGTGTKLFLLKVEFFQQVNAVQYILQNGEFNALRIIEVI